MNLDIDYTKQDAERLADKLYYKEQDYDELYIECENLKDEMEKLTDKNDSLVLQLEQREKDLFYVVSLLREKDEMLQQVVKKNETLNFKKEYYKNCINDILIKIT